MNAPRCADLVRVARLVSHASMVRSFARGPASRLTLVALALTVRVHAADAASEAQARFDEGKRLYRVKHDAEGARAKFAQAYALAPRLETLWNLALCELDLGHNEDAAAHLRRYARDPEAKASNLDRVPALLATARAKLGALRIEAAPEAVVRVDGHLVDPREWQGEAIDLAPGDHVVVVALGGERVEDIVAIRMAATTVHRATPLARVAESATASATAAPGLSVATQASPAPRDAQARAFSDHVLPLTLGALGLAALGGGVAFALASQGDDDEANRARRELAGVDCTNGDVGPCAQLRSAVDAGTTHAWLAVGGYALAGALIGSAAWLSWSSARDEHVEARVGPGGLALRVRY